MWRNPKRTSQRIRLFLIVPPVLIAGLALKARVPTNLNRSFGIPIHTLSFSPDDKSLVVASQALPSDVDDKFHWFKGGVGVYNVATKRLYQSLPYTAPLNPNILVEAYYSGDGKFLQINGTVIGNGDDRDEGSSVVYDASTLKMIKRKSLSLPQQGFAQSPSSERSFSARITELNHQPLTSIKTPTHHFTVKTQNAPSKLALDAANHELAIADSQGNISIVDLNTDKITSNFSCPLREQIPGNEAIESLLWLPQHNLLWVSNSEGRSIFWDASHHKIQADISLRGEMTCSAISHNGRSIALGYEGGRVQLLTVNEFCEQIDGGSAHLRAFLDQS